MRIFMSILVSLVFLLQSFVTVQAMPLREGKASMPCMIEKETKTTHACCTVLSTEKESSEKKNCCSGTFKMSCCVLIIAIHPPVYSYQFLKNRQKNSFFGNKQFIATYENTIFHPPILIS